jgi:uncharacterized membrane protein (DUF106 family)
MSEEAQGQGSAEQAKPKLPARGHPAEQFVVMLSFILAFIVLIDQNARAATGVIVGKVLEPLIGFGHQAPVLTVLLASVVMVVTTTAVRHYFTDYLKLARNQQVMREFQKEMREARKANNLHKMKKLTEMNKDLMALQGEQSSSQLKAMAVTMLVVIPVFAWLLVFIDQGQAAGTVTTFACPTVIRVPWDSNWCAGVNVQAPPLTFLPRWIALYSLFSIPLGQVVQRVLKARKLPRELAEQPA